MRVRVSACVRACVCVVCVCVCVCCVCSCVYVQVTTWHVHAGICKQREPVGPIQVFGFGDFA